MMSIARLLNPLCETALHNSSPVVVPNDPHIGLEPTLPHSPLSSSSTFTVISESEAVVVEGEARGVEDSEVSSLFMFYMFFRLT